MNISYCDKTGLLYVDGVAFTKEMIERAKTIVESLPDNTDQFGYGFVIEDVVNEGKVFLQKNSFYLILEARDYFCKMNDVDDIASDKDFEG